MKKAYQTAYLVGATGLMGSVLLPKLLKTYEKVVVLSRRSTGLNANNLEEHIFDFNDLNSNGNLIHHGDFFCCLGTTKKKAGSAEAFIRVEKGYVLKLARIAQMRGVSQFLYVSAVGASEFSPSFYLRTKAEIEKELIAIPFISTIIVRPSLLKGERKEFRPLEKIGELLLSASSPLLRGPLRSIRPIDAEKVAQVLVSEAIKQKPGNRILESEAIALQMT